MKFWYGASQETDTLLTNEFQKDLERLSKDYTSSSIEFQTIFKEKTDENIQTALALVLLFDQFPRNIYRNQSKAFSFDSIALDLSKKSIALGYDVSPILHPMQSTFFYLPLEHSENLQDQEMCVSKCEQAVKDFPSIPFLGFGLKYAKEH